MNLNQITVPSSNLNVAIPFYEKLGLKIIVEAKPHYARFACPDGGSTFSIHLTKKPREAEGIYVYFECENLDSDVAKLVDKGIKFDEMPNDKTWLWREARLKDPDNNQIILYYAGENRMNPPWRIKDQ
jgi:predicted enzyme related to lactoylglutathione lyase